MAPAVTPQGKFTVSCRALAMNLVVARSIANATPGRRWGGARWCPTLHLMRSDGQLAAMAVHFRVATSVEAGVLQMLN